jgi:hypothetical protein
MRFPRQLLTVTGLVIGAGLVFFLGVYGFGRYNEWRTNNRTEWEAKVKKAEDSAAFYKAAWIRDSSEYRDRIVPQWLEARAVAIRDPQTPESTKKVIRACDAIVSSCDSIQKTLRGQIRSLETQKNLLEHKPGPPRAVGYGLVMYDVIGLRPVFRVGGNLKILGPIHANVEGEYAIPSARREGVGDGFRVLVGARINLNR